MEQIVLPNSIMLAGVSEMLSEGHPVVISTKGGSMMPFIRGGKDSVELVRCDEYKPYDIVLAEVLKGHYVLHRVFSIDGDKVVLKGDGNLVGTEECRLENISGKAIHIIRPDGKKKGCTTACFLFRSRIWRKMPYFCRRVFLHFYRKTI